MDGESPNPPAPHEASPDRRLATNKDAGEAEASSVVREAGATRKYSNNNHPNDGEEEEEEERRATSSSLPLCYDRVSDAEPIHS